MEISNSRKISPVVYFDSNRVSVKSGFHSHRIKHSVSKAFIIKSFFLAGCVFPAEHKRAKWCGLDISIVEHIGTLLLVIYIIGHIWNSFVYASDLPMGLILSYILGDFFSLVMKVILFRKRQVILETMEYLQNVRGNFEPKGYFTRRSWMMVCFAACFLIPLTFFSLVTMRLCYKGSESLLPDFVKTALYGWESGNDRINCGLLITMDFLISDQEYVLPGFLIVLCCYIFDLLQQVISTFVVVGEADDVESQYLEYSQKIFLCVGKVEESLSLLLLVIYGFLIFSIFNVTTFILRADLFILDAETLIPQLLLAGLAITAFYVAGFQAVAVNSAAVRVKNYIHGMVSRIRSPDQIERGRMLLVMAEDFASRVHVSGWGLFQFKTSFIRQTASAMVTFGLILSQLGK